MLGKNKDLYDQAQAAHGRNDFEYAVACYEQLISRGFTSAKVYRALSASAYRSGMYLLSKRAAHEALAQNPERHQARFQLGLSQLMLGDWNQGWDNYRAVEAFAPPREDVPAHLRWQGERLDEQTLIIFDEQGYGDTIMFGRLAERIQRELAPNIVWQMRQALRPLWAQNRHLGDVVTASKITDFRWTRTSDLPYLLNLQPEEAEFYEPYLHITQATVATNPLPTPERLDPAIKKVGIVWNGSDGERGIVTPRSVPFDAFRPILDLAEECGIHFFHLQNRSSSELLTEHGYEAHVTELHESLGSFLDTAAYMMQLDLIITVDTAQAHLAAALGCPVWMLLPRFADARWGPPSRYSPWYPDLPIYRQTVYQDWTAPIDDIVADLREW